MSNLSTSEDSQPMISQNWFTLQAFRTNNKQVIIILKLGCPRLTLEGLKVKSDHIKRSQPMISYKLVSHCKPIRPLISEL